MSSNIRIGKAANLSSTTGTSFERELRSLVRVRVGQCMWIGLAVSIIVHFIFKFLEEGVTAPAETFFSAYKSSIIYLHLLSFAVGVALAHFLRGRPARWYHLLGFVVFGLNILLVMGFIGGCRPDYIPNFEMALMLLIPAAILPWPMRYQLALGLLAPAAFTAAQLYTYFQVPGYAAYWESAPRTFTNVMVWGVSSMCILGAVAAYISYSLYALRKTAHKAERLGNYEILEVLGQGGMGKVYLARHALMCRPTAVKVMQTPEQNAASAIARFEREVNLSASLTHPNTINIYDFGRTGDNVCYYAMEYLHGLDLHQLIEHNGPVNPERVVYLARQVCGSLNEAHDHDIIHRDIKPSNIYLTHRGGLYDFVKVLDFGLAKIINPAKADGVTQAGMQVGTPRYISPESLTGSTSLDGRSDIYNLGAVMYWMLTGRAPFESSSSVEAMVDHLKTVPRKPSEVTETPIPGTLDAIVMRCLEKKPEDRFSSAADLSKALKAIVFEQPWDQEQARAWWGLHGPPDRDLTACMPRTEDETEVLA